MQKKVKNVMLKNEKCEKKGGKCNKINDVVVHN